MFTMQKIDLKSYKGTSFSKSCLDWKQNEYGAKAPQLPIQKVQSLPFATLLTAYGTPGLYEDFISTIKSKSAPRSLSSTWDILLHTWYH